MSREAIIIMHSKKGSCSLFLLILAQALTVAFTPLYLREFLDFMSVKTNSLANLKRLSAHFAGSMIKSFNRQF